jgi:signal transduction histidine kinase
VMFSGLFLLAGLALLLINYVVVNETLPDGTGVVNEAFAGHAREEQVTVIGPNGEVPPTGPPTAFSVTRTAVETFRVSTMRQLLIASGIALVVAAALAALLGWWTARRALRPVHTITATARRLEAESLDHRIDLVGPDDELKELADTFDRMLDRLAASFDSQKRFVANASHELRTPLAVQRTLVEVAMADPTASPELLRLGQHLLHTNERSERLIDGLLVLARSDQGLVSRLPVRLDEVADAVLRSATGMATEQGVTVASRLEPRTVVGDHVLLERLVTNLVQNALHYNEPGGTVRVHVGAEPAIVVINTGPVVPGEAVPGLFEPFRRLDRSRAAGRDGAGLGLSIVRSIVKAHNGVVYAEPNLGGGLRITVHLPGLHRALSPSSASAETLAV